MEYGRTRHLVSALVGLADIHCGGSRVFLPCSQTLMSLSNAELLGWILGYMGLLSAVAYSAERGILPKSLSRHPLIYVLSLGVAADAMASFGAMELAERFGYGFLLYYIGIALVFFLSSTVVLPLLRLRQVYQLGSLADLLAFRFRSTKVGMAVTLAMFLLLLPLFALQIDTVSQSVSLLSGSGGEENSGQHLLGLLFCLAICVFTILFGTREQHSQHQHDGLVVAIAFGSLLKLVAMLTLMFAAIFAVFGDFTGLQHYLAQNPTQAQLLENEAAVTRAALLMFIAGAIAMPQLYQMAFKESPEHNHLNVARWALPLYLLLLSLPVLPIYWANLHEGTLTSAFAALSVGLSLNSTSLALVGFLLGLSAASATLIVATLALANMALYHWVLPLRHLGKNSGEHSIYQRLRLMRRLIIVSTVMISFAFSLLIAPQSMSDLGLASFSGAVQFLPALIATLYWSGANRHGLLWGLCIGGSIWMVLILLPLAGIAPSAWLNVGTLTWHTSMLLALFVNSVIFVTVSLLTATHESERVASAICATDMIGLTFRHPINVSKASEFIDRLKPALGAGATEKEVRGALADLNMNINESRPFALRQLRRQLEARLSSLLGTAVSSHIIDTCLPYSTSSALEDINLIEHELRGTPQQLRGIAGELDELRQYYRAALENLPLGVCQLGIDGEILLWNKAMERITGISSEAMLGSSFHAMAEPWRKAFEPILHGRQALVQRREVRDHLGQHRWLCLHRATGDNNNPYNGLFMVEDITDAQRFEHELLHNERLASIGRLAAGVAHEIGNPVTGISCLAQNLLDEGESEDTRASAQDILSQTDRITRTVQTLVDFSHAGPGDARLNLSSCPLAERVDEAIHLLSLGGQSEEMEYDNLCDHELTVLADAQQLLQVFINLLSNARDACDGHGVVSVSAHRDDHDIVIRVEDNGTGISRDLQAQIFEPFVTTKDVGSGTGLGLALVYSMVNDMRGSIGVTSPIYNEGAPGTRFSIRLPQG